LFGVRLAKTLLTLVDDVSEESKDVLLSGNNNMSPQQMGEIRWLLKPENRCDASGWDIILSQNFTLFFEEIENFQTGKFT